MYFGCIAVDDKQYNCFYHFQVLNKHNLDKDHTISQTELENAFEDVSINYRIISGT